MTVLILALVLPIPHLKYLDGSLSVSVLSKNKSLSAVYILNKHPSVSVPPSNFSVIFSTFLLIVVILSKEMSNNSFIPVPGYIAFSTTLVPMLYAVTHLNSSVSQVLMTPARDFATSSAVPLQENLFP